MRKTVFIILALFVVSGLQLGFAQELTVYSFPPAVPLDWSSPLKLAFGAGVKGKLVFEHGKNKHSIGHCFMELTGPNGEREITGMTTAPDAPSDADFITKHGYGLGVLFAPMKGALDDGKKLDGELKDRYKTGKVTFLKFKVTNEMYKRMQTYLTEYRAKGYDKTYNGMNEPRKGLGAGCSAFAVSFLDVGNMIDPVFEKEWIRRVKMPKSLVGGPVTGNKVSLRKLLFTAHWAKKNEEYVPLEMWDPQLIFEWVHKLAEKAKFARVHNQKSNEFKILGKPFKFIKRGKALGIYVDATHMKTPNDPIWQDNKK